MLPKSPDRRDGVIPFASLAGKRTEPELTITASHVSPERVREPRDEERMHIFWRVFGGALISIAGLVGITLYNSVQTNIAELRAEITKLNDLRSELVKKDEFNHRITTSHERINTVLAQCGTDRATLVSLKTELDGHKERSTKLATDLDGLRKDTASTIEAVKKDMAALELAKEKITGLILELKQVREDLQKARADVDKNQVADQERKARRDEQQKECEKILKELAAALADCREKLARLEGLQQASPPKKDGEKP